MSDGLSWVGVRGSDTGVVGLRTVCWLSDEVDCPFPPQVILSSPQVLHRKNKRVRVYTLTLSVRRRWKDNWSRLTDGQTIIVFVD